MPYCTATLMVQGPSLSFPSRPLTLLQLEMVSLSPWQLPGTSVLSPWAPGLGRSLGPGWSSGQPPRGPPPLPKRGATQAWCLPAPGYYPGPHLTPEEHETPWSPRPLPIHRAGSEAEKHPPTPCVSPTKHRWLRKGRAPRSGSKHCL